MIDILRTDGHWGDGTLVCQCCRGREAPPPAAGGPALCVPCDEYLRGMMKHQLKHGVWKVKRMLAAGMQKLTGGDA